MTESKNILSLTECTSKAGKARAAKLSPERRSEIAKIANNARNSKGLPRATHSGILKFGDIEISCAVLGNKTRVISSESIRNALGLSNPNSKKIKKSEIANLPTFLSSDNLSPYYLDIFNGPPSVIEYINKMGHKTKGMEATCLPKICEVYLKARESGALSKHQIPIAITAEIIIRSLAQIGIIALVDESSGYQEDRARDELQTLIKQFINEDLLKWTQKFPHQFFREIYKIHGWNYKPGQTNHPHCLGNFITKYVYNAISPEVKEELQKRNPILEETGNRAHKHHQYLTPEVGIPALDKHLIQMIGLLKASRTKEEFKELFDRVFSEEVQSDWVNKQ